MRNKQTKIIATISDLKCDKKFIKELYDNGMDVVRINSAHQSLESAMKTIQIIRNVSEKIAILIDTKGPEIRTRDVQEPIVLKNDVKVCLKYGNEKMICDEEYIYVSHNNFISEIPESCPILIDDGEIELKCIEKKKDCIIAKVIDGGVLKGRKGVNVPNAKFSLPALTSKDKAFISFAIENDIDFIAHSFVRNKDDVIEIQKMLDASQSECKIIAKIENQEGVQNISTILPHVYGIMVARGDLAVELSPEEIPLVQKRIIRKCIEHAKPVIVATQMLQSMIDNPRPTRAEVSDVANAVFDGASAVMLSGETAYGNFPIKSVQMMSKIAKQVESNKKAFRKNNNLKWGNEIHEFFARKSIEACASLDIKAIFVATKTGATARLLSSFRGKIPIYAETFSKKVVREMSLLYGVYPSFLKRTNSMDKLVERASKNILKEVTLNPEDLILFIGSTPHFTQGTDFLEIRYVKDMM